MSLPTREEINPTFDDLDGRVACEHFFGKTLDEAETLLRENHRYEEDLMWMGSAAFRYYFPAADRFIRSDAATGEVSFISGVAYTLEYRLEYEPLELFPIALQLEQLCLYVIEHWLRFAPAADMYDEWARFYGDVLTRYRSLQLAFSRLQADA